MPFEMSFDEPGESLPVCRHLRTKAMIVTGEMNPGDSNEVGSGHCWCNQTQHVFGPDDQLVERRQCITGRECYEAVL